MFFMNCLYLTKNILHNILIVSVFHVKHCEFLQKSRNIAKFEAKKTRSKAYILNNRTQIA